MNQEWNGGDGFDGDDGARPHDAEHDAPGTFAALALLSVVGLLGWWGITRLWALLVALGEPGGGP